MIEINNICKSFGDLKVLNDVSFKIEEGKIFGIVGHSGAGKSTLLRCINGLEGYDSGSIKVGGYEVKDNSKSELRELRKNVGMIFQNFNLMSRNDVYENIALPLNVWSKDKKFVKERVLSLLSLVGLEDKIHSKIKELSGGQKQRVGIARALALEPNILLCDEATSALDPNTTMSILNLLVEINKKLNITIVVVTHQMEVIKQVCSEVVLLEGGELKEWGKVEDLFMRPGGELKKLIGEQEVIPETGVNIKIYFPKDSTQSSLITSIARELNMDFSIVWGRLEKFGDNVLGSLIINIKNDEEEKITRYLNEKSVIWEVIKNVI